MAQLLGDLWDDGEPDWTAALAQPGVHLHLYGKRRPARAERWGISRWSATTPPMHYNEYSTPERHSTNGEPCFPTILRFGAATPTATN